MKTHTIIGVPGENLEGYQMRYVIHRGSGTDSGQDVYLAGQSLSWPYDFRFTNYTQLPFSYWIESFDENTATVWVKIDHIPAATSTYEIKFYYGKAGDRGASNGDATFLLFDDFSGEFDRAKWTRVLGPGARVIQQDGELDFYGTGSDSGRPLVRSSDRLGRNILITATERAYSPDSIGGLVLCWDGDTGGQWNSPRNAYSLEYSPPSADVKLLATADGVPVQLFNRSIRPDTAWHTVSFGVDNSGNIRGWLDGVMVISDTNASLTQGYVGLYGREQPFDVRAGFKNVYVRQYQLHEPSYGPWASGETAPVSAAPPMPPMFSGYSYSASHSIAGSTDGLLSDYQVKFIIHRGTGVDSGGEVYLDGHSQSWPNDIRFTDSSGNLLAYWIESSDDNTATVWVKITSIPAAGTKVILYYGKGDDRGASSITDTMLFGDDFGDGRIDTARWQASQHASERSGTMTLGNSQLTRHWVVSKASYAAPYVLEYRGKVDREYPNMRLVAGIHGSAYDYIGETSYGYICNNLDTANENSGYTTSKYYDKDSFERLISKSMSHDTNVWYRGKINAKTDGIDTYLYTDDGTLKESGSTVDTWRTSGYVTLECYGNLQCTWDYVFIRKYAQDEPAHGDWDSRQPATAPTSTPQEQITGYSYLKSHELVGSTDGALTDYPVRLSIHRGNGRDDQENVYLAGHSQRWPDDIRFTDAGGNPLSFWTETANNSTALVWVKIPQLPASPGRPTITLYYGNASASPASDIEDTFLFADDFTYFDNASKWQNNSYVHVEQGTELRISTSLDEGYYTCNPIVTRQSNFSPGEAAIVRLKGNGYMAHYNFDFGYKDDDNRVEIQGDYDAPGTHGKTYLNGSSAITGNLCNNKEVYHTYEILRYPAGDRIGYQVDGKAVASLDSSVYGGEGAIRLGPWVKGSEVIVDWIAVRPLAQHEPAHGGWSPENAIGAVPSATPEPEITPSPTAAPAAGQSGLNNFVLLLIGLVALVLVAVIILLALIIFIVILDQRMNK